MVFERVAFYMGRHHSKEPMQDNNQDRLQRMGITGSLGQAMTYLTM